MNDVLGELRCDPKPQLIDPDFDKRIAAVLRKDAAVLAPEDLTATVEAIANYRPSVVPYLFRNEGLPSVEQLLLAAWDRRSDLAWRTFFWRESLRRDRVVQAVALDTDINKSTNLPGARKRLPKLLASHEADSGLLEAIRVAVAYAPPHDGGIGVQRTLLCAWLTADGSGQSAVALRAYGDILTTFNKTDTHAADIVRQYAANDLMAAVAGEIPAAAN